MATVRWSEEDHRRSANRAASQPYAFQVIENTDSSKGGSGGGSVRAPEAPELIAFRAQVLVLRRTYVAAEARVTRCEEQCWAWEDILAYQQQHLGNTGGSSALSSLQSGGSPMSSSTSTNAALRSPLLNYSDINDDDDDQIDATKSSNMHDLIGDVATSNTTTNTSTPTSPNIVWWDGTISGPWATAWHTKWQQKAMLASAVFFGCGSVLVVLVEVASLLDASTAASNGYGAIDGIGVKMLGSPVGCTILVGIALLHVIATLAWATCAFAGKQAIF